LPAVSAVTGAPVGPASAARPRLISVLLVDDTATVRLLLRRTLESSRAFVVVGEAADGRAAVNLAESLRPDLVLLDLAMPVMDGMEAIPLICRFSPETRIVVLSGSTSDNRGEDAVAAGATAFLEKRYRPDELIARLFEICRAPARPDGPDPPGAVPRPVESLAREAQERFRLAFEHAPIGMAVVGADDRFLQVNASLCQIAGYGEGELLARSLADISHPDDRDDAIQVRQALLVGDSPSSAVETRLRRPDGRVVWALVSCSVVRDDAGRPSQLVAQVVDISERKRAEHELTRSNADLTSFAYLAAHELKSPLQAVSGFAALLERVHGPSLDPQAQEFVRWIIDGSSRMDSLIEDLLAYCSVDASEPVLATVDLDDVLAHALVQLEPEIADRQAVVSAGRMPVVTADAVQMGQLLRNLVANALKFVPPAVAPVVHLSAERTEGSWTVTVADNGIGVDEAHRERIFAMFERLHSRELYKGTGIGLSICKRIAERRGGAVWVEPNPGGGSRFRFSIPDDPPPSPS